MAIPRRASLWVVLALLIGLPGCTSFQPLSRAPAPAEPVQLSANSGRVRIEGVLRVDQTRAVRCVAREFRGVLEHATADTVSLRDARAAGLALDAPAECREALDGFVVAEAGGPLTLAGRRFDGAKTGLLAVVVAVTLFYVLTADYDITLKPNSCSFTGPCVVAPAAVPTPP